MVQGQRRAQARRLGFQAESYAEGLEALEELGGLRMRIREVKIGRNGGGEVGGAFDGVYWTPKSVKKEISGKLGLSCRGPAMTVLSSFSYRRGLNPCSEHDSVPPNALVVCARGSG